jgi:hypothetical protein
MTINTNISPYRLIECRELESIIKPFPLVTQCFSKYIQWLCKHAKSDVTQYDLIVAIYQREMPRLIELEKHLKVSCNALHLSTKEFIRAFGFENDLLTLDPEKVHDVLAELIFITDLKAQGFSSIRKIPNSIKVGGASTPAADFIAQFRRLKFAIEFKTVRPDKRERPGVWLGDGTKPFWWGNVFKSNATMKIKDKNYHAFTQLDNTHKHYSCDRKMLAIYSRRAASTLMTPSAYVGDLKELIKQFPQLDYLACKDYRSGKLLIYPPLSSPFPRSSHML